MVDLSRLRGIALALAGLLVAMGLVDLGLTAAVGRADRWLPYGEEPNDHWVVDSAGTRLGGLVRQGWRGGDEVRPLGVLLGQSTLQCGVDAAGLSARPGAPRFLNLFGVGGSINKINDISDLLVFSGIRPAVVVLAINDYMLAGLPRERVVAMNDRRTPRWSRVFNQRVWTWGNRRIVNYLAVVATHRARLGLFRLAGRGIEAMYAPAPDPWRKVAAADPPMDEAERAGRIRATIGALSDLGQLDPARFRTDGSSALALAGLVRRHRGLGSSVVVVRMPMHSVLRDRLPPEAGRCLEDVCRGESAEGPLPVIDLRDAVPDALFADPIHLGLEGRQFFTALLADRLQAAAVGHDRPGTGVSRGSDRPHP